MSDAQPSVGGQAPGEVAVGALHEVNQTLSIMAGFVELAQTALQHGDLASAEARFRLATRAALHAASSSTRLLSAAQALPAPSPVLVDVSQLLHEVAQLTYPQWGPAAERQGRTFWVSVEAPPGLHMAAQPPSVQAALIDLIMNAVDTLPDGGGISMRAAQQDDRVVVEVATGGLFRISVPASGPARPAVAEVRPATGRPLRVLVVEDVPALRQMIRLILGRAGHVVHGAASVTEAIAHLQRAACDLIISELSFGQGLSGLELAGAARRIAPRAHFILASGSAHALSEAEYARRGVDLVLDKPFTPAQLRDAVARLQPSELEHGADASLD